jgi:hypothetical protein
MIVCFAPLTLMFAALLSRGAFMTTGALPLDAWFVGMLLTAALGPLGLAVAFRAIVLEWASIGAVTMAILCALAAWIVLAFGLSIMNADYPGSAWREFTLLAVLPALGVAHLAYLRLRSRARLAA